MTETIDRHAGRIAVLIVIAALALRLVYAYDELPFAYDPDERLFIGKAARIALSGDLNPQWFGHPGTLYIYAVAAVFRVSCLFGALDCPYGMPLDRVVAWEWYEPHFLVAARLVTVAFSGLAFFGTWILARRLLGPGTALLALFFLACIPLHIALSANARTDVPQTAFMLLAVHFSLRAYDAGRLAHFVLAGAMIGLAVAVKYPSVVMAVPVVLAAAFRAAETRSAGERRALALSLAAAAAASLVACFIASPYLFLEFGRVLQNLRFEARAYHLSATNPGVPEALLYYLATPLRGLGVLGLALAALGAVNLLQARRGIIIVAAFLAYLLFISSLNLRWERWAAPLLPFFAIFAAAGARTAFGALERRLSGRWRAAAVVALLAALAAAPLSGAARAMSLALTPGAQTLGFAWIRENVAAGSRIFVERNTIHLPPGVYRVFVEEKGRPVPLRLRSAHLVPRGHAGALESVEGMLESVDYVVTGMDYERFANEKARFRRALERYDGIFDRCEEVAAFRSEWIGFVWDSVARICKVKPAPG